MKLSNNNILKNFANQIDLFNTLNGGVSMTTVTVKETDKYINLTITTPTVSPDFYKVFLNNNVLTVLVELPQEAESNKASLVLPIFYKTFDLPFYVDADKIDAVFENDKLTVMLPIKEGGKNQQKQIEVRYI